MNLLGLLIVNVEVRRKLQQIPDLLEIFAEHCASPNFVGVPDMLQLVVVVVHQPRSSRTTQSLDESAHGILEVRAPACPQHLTY